MTNLPSNKPQIGTFACWLVGHKFLAKDVKREDGSLKTSTRPIDYCIRCGIHRKELL